MTIGKRTLAQSASNPSPKLDPYAAVQMRIDHAEVLLRELRESHLPALRRAIEGRALDAARSADVRLRRELAEIRREMRDAQRTARELSDQMSSERATRLDASVAALADAAEGWLALAPSREPTSEVVLIAHVPGDDAAFRAKQAEHERAWFEMLDRASRGIADLAARREKGSR
jgi:hypothetical protein